MDVTGNAKDDSTTQNVLDAYNEVLRKLKEARHLVIDESKLEAIKLEEETAQENAQLIEEAIQDTPDNLVKHLADLKIFVGKTLDDVKLRLLPEYEKFFTVRKAISLSEAQLDELYHIKVQAETLTALVTAQKERVTAHENEMAELRKTFAQKKLQLTRELESEEADYIVKRDAIRRLDQEKYESSKHEIEKALAEKRAAFEEEFESREVRIAAREKDHQAMKEKEAWILAREQEYFQLKEKVAHHTEELRLAVQKSEKAAIDKLTSKYEYEAKLMHIEIETERKMFHQKIAALEDQIGQYKMLKQVFGQPSSFSDEQHVTSNARDTVEENFRNFGSLASSEAIEGVLE